ncbi:unnamed protein product, partial [Didymodactylos carnosus]
MTDVKNPDNVEIHSGKDMLNVNDDALSQKLHLVNNAIDEIGFTSYQLKLFFLNGFGYGVDSLLLLLSALVQPQVILQYQPSVSKAQTIALYVGLLVGALVWGSSADIIGRKYAFNISLLWCSIFAIVAGASPNYFSVCIFVALLAFGGGGNLILDTTVYLEFLPSKYQWSLTFMALWWGVGQMTASLVAWPFLANYSCSDAINCNNSNNQGWRYTFYTLGSLVFILSLLRITVIRLKESPKWLLSQGRDKEVVEILQYIAESGKRSCSLTVEMLEAIGPVLAYSTSLNFASWSLIGLAFPLYNVFLPIYLQSRGRHVDGDGSTYTTYRNYAIINVCGIFGPVIAGGLVEVKYLGRKYTMVIGALLTMGFLFAYTGVKTAAQNLAFNCLISICLNIYYGTLYAYTPEILPAAHRGTGNAISVSCNRIMGIVAALIGSYADLTSSIPIYVCAASFGVLAILSILFPFESL